MGGRFKSLGNRLVRCFLAGVFALLPIVITVGVVAWVADFLTRFIGPETFIGEQLNALGVQFAIDSPEAVSYSIGWVIVLAGVFLLGVVIEMGAKNSLQRLLDALLTRIPLVGKLYGSSRQVVDMLGKSDDDNLKGMKPVFCYFGRENPTCFLALLVSPKRFQLEGVSYRIVIVPTAPVPFGGALLFVPDACVRDAQISVDALMSIYVSMGATAAEYLPESPAGEGGKAS